MKNSRARFAARGWLAEIMRPLVSTIDWRIGGQLAEEPFQRDPVIISLMLPLIEAINFYFAAEVRGWQHVPKDGPVLIVGNHSGGAEPIDVAPILARWVRERGIEAPLYMLGYDLLFAYPVAGWLLRKLGLVPASPRVARRALARGAAVVVFPGGDYEAFRPWSERNQIEFDGRTGFIRLALSMRVPVVPMTIHGAHQSTIVLTRGRRIADAMGLDRLRIKVFPFIWNIPLGVTPALVPTTVLPSKVTVQLGKPLDWSRYDPHRAGDPVVVQRCYDEITGTMQTTLDALANEHPHPILARLDEILPTRMLGYGRAAARELTERRIAPRPAVGRAKPSSQRRVTGIANGPLSAIAS